MQYPVMRESGFRFVGMKVYRKGTDDFEDYGREYGYNMKLDEFLKGFEIYLSLFHSQHLRFRDFITEVPNSIYERC